MEYVLLIVLVIVIGFVGVACDRYYLKWKAKKDKEINKKTETKENEIDIKEDK